MAGGRGREGKEKPVAEPRHFTKLLYLFRFLGASTVTRDPIIFTSGKLKTGGRRGGLMVSELDSGSSGPGSSPGRRHCVVFLGKTLNSHSASLHPGAGGNPAMD